MNRSFTVTINNNIVTQRCRTIKKMALFSLKGNWLVPMAVSLAFSILTGLPEYIGGFFEAPETGFDLPFFILNIVSVAITGAVTMSTSAYYLNVFRMVPAGKRELMTGIKYYKKAVLFGAIQFLLSIIISQGLFLASLFAIVAYLSFVLAYFVLADNPEKTASQCLATSRFMMTGNRTKFIKLMISFIGWILLANFLSTVVQVALYPGVIEEMNGLMTAVRDAAQVGGMVNMDTYAMPVLEASSSDIFVQLSRMLLNLGVSVYINTSIACFYDLAAGNIITEGDKTDPFAPAGYGNNTGNNM